MVDIKLERDYPFAAQAVWRVLADFSDMRWAGMEKMEVEGQGIGMLRKIDLGMPEPVVEKLVSLDEEQMSFSYAIDSGNPLPARDYMAGAKVFSRGENACRLEWWCRCQVEGMPEADVAGILKDSYAGLLKSLATHLSA